MTYQHHGIDVGDGTVVHARPHDFRNPFGGGRVVRTSLTQFAEGRNVRVRNEPPAAFPPEAIVERALAHVDREGYHLVVDNCEHFTTWCATGRRESRQVDIVMGRIAAGASRVAAVVAARSAARVAVRTATGTAARAGLGPFIPAAVVGEAAACAAEWTAHQRGASERESRRAGEAAGLTATSVACAIAGATAGPMGIVAGTIAGFAIWLTGSAVAAATGQATNPVRLSRSR